MRTIVCTGTLPVGAGSVMDDGMADTMAGFEPMWAWHKLRKFSTDDATSLSSAAHACRHPDTFCTKAESGQKQSGLALSVQFVVNIHVFRQRGRDSGHEGVAVGAAGADEVTATAGTDEVARIVVAGTMDTVVWVEVTGTVSVVASVTAMVLPPMVRVVFPGQNVVNWVTITTVVATVLAGRVVVPTTTELAGADGVTAGTDEVATIVVAGTMDTVVWVEVIGTVRVVACETAMVLLPMVRVVLPGQKVVNWVTMTTVVATVLAGRVVVPTATDETDEVAKSVVEFEPAGTELDAAGTELDAAGTELEVAGAELDEGEPPVADEDTPEVTPEEAGAELVADEETAGAVLAEAGVVEAGTLVKVLVTVQPPGQWVMVSMVADVTV